MIPIGGSVVKGGIKYVFVHVSSALSKSGLPDLDYALNPYVGCYHKCRYCYARSYCRYEEPRTRWGDVIYVKGNVVNLLRSEVRRLRVGAVGVSTVTDPYQPIDALTGITRRCIDLLLKSGFRVVIQTKSPLVLRDLDILKLRPDLVEVGFTVTTLDEHLMKGVEVRAPPPSARVNALRRIAETGLRTWIFLGPIIPGLNDDLRGIKEIIDVAQETNSTLYYDWLRFRDGLEVFFRSVGLDPIHYVRRGSYSEWRRVVEEGITRICKDKGVVCKPAFTS